MHAPSTTCGRCQPWSPHALSNLCSPFSSWSWSWSWPQWPPRSPGAIQQNCPTAQALRAHQGLCHPLKQLPPGDTIVLRSDPWEGSPLLLGALLVNGMFWIAYCSKGKMLVRGFKHEGQWPLGFFLACGHRPASSPTLPGPLFCHMLPFLVPFTLYVISPPATEMETLTLYDLLVKMAYFNLS